MAVAVHAIVARGMLHFAFYVRVLTCRSCRVFSSQVFVLISMGVDVPRLCVMSPRYWIAFLS